MACHALGHTSEAQCHFARATELQGEPLYALSGIQEGEYLLACGDGRTARDRTLANLVTCERNEWGDDEARCHALLGLLCLANDLAEARTHLDAVRNWTARTGQLECILRAHHLAAEIARVANDLPGALAEARTGLHLANGCDHGRFAIDLLLALARIHLAIPEPRPALSRARQALDRAQQPDCQYVWAEADALHLCGLGHQALGESDLARQRLAAALMLRQRLGHPGLEHTRTSNSG